MQPVYTRAMPSPGDAAKAATGNPGDFYSIGQLVAMFHVRHAAVEGELQARVIPPAFRLNGTPYYGPDAVDALRAKFAPPVVTKGAV